MTKKLAAKSALAIGLTLVLVGAVGCGSKNESSTNNKSDEAALRESMQKAYGSGGPGARPAGQGAAGQNR